MLENKKFSIACTEVLEILKNIEEIEYEKIDKDFILMLEECKDKEYQFAIDPIFEFSELKLTDATHDLLGYIYRKYWATKEEKKEFDKAVLANEDKEKEKAALKKKYYELFPDEVIDTRVREIKQELIVRQENGKHRNVFVRLFNFIKNCSARK